MPVRLARSFSLFTFCSLLSVFVFWSSGCGYHFPGAGNLPKNVQRVQVAEIENETLTAGAEKEFQWALEREFRNHGSIAVADDGEGVINIVLHRLDLRPLSFDSRDQVLEYEVSVIFDAQLTDRNSGQVLWHANGMRVTSDYSAIPQVTVTSSPEFQRGTLNPEDLGGFTDIQFSETQRRTATSRLFALAAREVYSRLGDDF